jgi:16S rRNA (adenine1518-N6/adenine1519-N6)-dimethyltransferase
MIDQNLVRVVAAAGLVTVDDAVIEVGPGTGTLTEELLAAAGEVIAVEIDRDLAALLREQFANRPNFSLIEGDALAGKHELNPDLLGAMQTVSSAGKHLKLVANLPYNIASPLIINLLNAGVELLAFTVQKEVADRLRALPGSDDYGPLSIVAQLLAKVEVLRVLPPQAFWPAPKIDSALVRMTLQDQLGDRSRAFSDFVHRVFSFRRKTLRKALSQAGHDPEMVLSTGGWDGTRRPEEFSPAEFLAMFASLQPPTGST